MTNENSARFVPVPAQSRQSLYEREREAFLATIAGQSPPDRTAAHELQARETLLRATGVLVL